ncbi:calcium-binding protein [Oculatella sp. LEGE 06141]|uniref:calcium-binding protein n=1 Tax=Oculatella sp. LEGE 06141 TaxID=1828648 RepID=UPI0018805CCF|nr:calcium-binding protein [Oculatella sp. LEGE 06141]MBE9180894.1 calcium-binding protein [Oculatella sp. LEGE 06141]
MSTTSGMARSAALQGGSLDDILVGSNDTIDFINGGDGNDILNAGDGGSIFQAVYGGNGDDQLFSGNGLDYLSGGNGNDIVRGGDDSPGLGDYLHGDAGDDQVFGEGGDDKLFGGTGNDRLFGGTGNDELNGDDGDDLLDGYGGIAYEQDQLTGGRGADIFVLGTADGGVYYTGDTQGFADGYAVITDFSATQGDKIQVVGNLADYRIDTTQNLVGGGSLDAAIYRGNDLIAVLRDRTSLVAARDFVVIPATAAV